MKRKISILGSTGSIGTQALEVIDQLQDKFEIYALAGGNNVELLKEQIRKYKPQKVSIKEEKFLNELKTEFSSVKFNYGDDGLNEIASDTENNTVLIAVTGINGLFPTLSAIKNNIDVALANKETLVAAGSIVMEALSKSKSKLLPVDSEHSAIHQCLCSDFKNAVQRLVLTASGGPFRDKTREEMQNVTIEDTLAHPKWNMGSKITVDSATLMNKGLEVIEAHHMFNVDYDDIDVVIHPQSIIHSAVEYKDGSLIAQLGWPSMHIPIQYAISHPERINGIKTRSFNLFEAAKLEFFKPDYNKFPCLKLAFEAGRLGGTYTTVLNAVNEEAVYEYLKGTIKLTDIAKVVDISLELHVSAQSLTIEEIIAIDKEARIKTQEIIKKIL
ncbi:MAG: 1-deoxy-D-xylulose-5-phosphate reductoisomerase [bacterium]